MPAWEKNPPKVAIGIPFGGNVTPEWALQFSRLQKPKSTIYITEDAPAVDYAREDIVRTFLETKARNLFFLRLSSELYSNSSERSKNKRG